MRQVYGDEAMTDDYYAQMYWSGVNNYDVELADLKAELTRAQANGDFAGAVAAAAMRSQYRR